MPPKKYFFVIQLIFFYNSIFLFGVLCNIYRLYIEVEVSTWYVLPSNLASFPFHHNHRLLQYE